jgi:chitinase
MRSLAVAAAFLACATPVRAIWITAYYAGWRQGILAPTDIDFAAFTQLVHFSVMPREDGTLDTSINQLSAPHAAATVRAAHAAGRKALFTVGGQSSRERFLGAISPAHREKFIANLVRFLTEYGYDGIDVDMEEITPADRVAYARFIRDLKKALGRISPRPMLTAAVLWEPELFARLAEEFDQINVMTYNLAGPYPGWVTWHGAAVYGADHRTPNRHVRLPSTDGAASAFLAAGVPRKKLGIGLSFYGHVWSGAGVTRPGQRWSTAPSMSDSPFFALAEAFGLTENDTTHPGYHWDDRAQAPYLSLGRDGAPDGLFVSYENARSARSKLQYIRQRGLGGLIIWELGAGYRVSQPPGRRDALLQSVKQEASAP